MTSATRRINHTCCSPLGDVVGTIKPGFGWNDAHATSLDWRYGRASAVITLLAMGGKQAEDMAFKLIDGMSRRRDLVTLGAQGLVIGEGDRVLLIRHGYRPGWHFPGGGVEVGETVETALARELHEEAGVVLKSPAEFRGLYANFRSFPGDHIALFLVRAWEQPAIPRANAEIAEQAFFHWQDLPETTHPGTRRRLAEVFGGAAVIASW